MDPFEQQWQARFERFARSYETEHQVSGWSERGLQRRFRACIECLSPYLGQRSMDVLDVGCGAGTYVRFFAQHGHRVIGVDYSVPTIRKARTLDPDRRARYLCGGIYHLPFGSEQFDIVLSIGVMQAITQPWLALGELGRVLRKGGIVIVEALNAWECFAIGKRLIEKVRRQPPRLHTYSPLQMQRWLQENGLDLIKKVPVMLLPRQWNDFKSADTLEHGLQLLGNVPFAPLGLAHSFLYVAAKAPLANGFDGSSSGRSSESMLSSMISDVGK
ncbi:MAG: class I SAM-dependent methyltransferase [Nitrospirae bacterium]|nr:MAG: class I SAM-dependent methyltransferase [Nitrospirota bacterium]